MMEKEKHIPSGSLDGIRWILWHLCPLLTPLCRAMIPLCTSRISIFAQIAWLLIFIIISIPMRLVIDQLGQGSYKEVNLSGCCVCRTSAIFTTENFSTGNPPWKFAVPVKRDRDTSSYYKEAQPKSNRCPFRAGFHQHAVSHLDVFFSAHPCQTPQSQASTFWFDVLNHHPILCSFPALNQSILRATAVLTWWRPLFWDVMSHQNCS